MSAINIAPSNFTIVLTGPDADAVNALLASIQANPVRAKAFAAEYRIGMGYGQIDGLANQYGGHLINLDGTIIITGDYASSLNSLLYGIQTETPGANNLADLDIHTEHHTPLARLWATIHNITQE